MLELFNVTARGVLFQVGALFYYYYLMNIAGVWDSSSSFMFLSNTLMCFSTFIQSGILILLFPHITMLPSGFRQYGYKAILAAFYKDQNVFSDYVQIKIKRSFVDLNRQARYYSYEHYAVGITVYAFMCPCIMYLCCFEL